MVPFLERSFPAGAPSVLLPSPAGSPKAHNIFEFGLLASQQNADFLAVDDE
jgi:hypothetical protein